MTSVEGFGVLRRKKCMSFGKVKDEVLESNTGAKKIVY